MSASEREQRSRRCVFYFDLGSPYAYLTAERISGVFADANLAQPEWKPILLGGLFQRFDRDSWANGDGRAEGVAEVERRASEYGLPPLVWPDPFPGNTLFAMRAATFAKQTGRTVSFALAGFRQAFAAGRDLTEPDNVLIAAAACEMHPTAVVKGVGLESTRRLLAESRERAAADGVTELPSIWIGGQVLAGERAIPA